MAATARIKGGQTPTTSGRGNLNRAWLSLILMLLTLFGVFYLGTGVQMEAIQGQPLNIPGLVVTIIVGILFASSTVGTVLFGLRAYRMGVRTGLIPVIVGIGGGVLLIILILQVVVGLATGRWY